MMNVTFVVLGLLLLTALWTVLTPTLLRAAIGLALTSALLTIVMFQMDGPLAGAFELSVCAGLITVVFISTISLMRPRGEAEARARGKAHVRAFLPLIAILGAIGAGLWMLGYHYNASLPPATETDVRAALWGLRRLDLIGQLLVIFVGVFGVVILFKEQRQKAQQPDVPTQAEIETKREVAK